MSSLQMVGRAKPNLVDRPLSKGKSEVQSIIYVHALRCNWMLRLNLHVNAGWTERILFSFLRNDSIFSNTVKYHTRPRKKGSNCKIVKSFSSLRLIQHWTWPFNFFWSRTRDLEEFKKMTEIWFFLDWSDFSVQLAGAGYGVGVRMLELVCFRDKQCKREIKVCGCP